jgi:murein DD-endopeptidase MepM/ murein hydrolase activator NlpD/SH3-like domain-containing protein
MLRPMTIRRQMLLWMITGAIGLSGCTAVRLVDPAPHDGYSAMLRGSGLDRTALGQDWLRVSEGALQKPVTIASPFQETGYLPPAEAAAVGYRLDLQRGRRLSIDVAFDSGTAPARLFVDLFRVQPDGRHRRVASLGTDQTALVHEVDADGSYILRLQPELLRGGRFTVTGRTLASVMFPIPGRTADSVQSLFGAERDAGARSHEGVDIFVPRGTPAVAVAAGTARTSVNNLGGNVVWLRAEGKTFYYAHLERWAFEGVAQLREGDVLGYVGNTGNARTTSPHLHFGIYDRGAINPLPFLRPDEPVPAVPAEPYRHLGAFVRIAAPRAILRDGPAPDRSRLAPLERHMPVRVLGATRRWLRVSLPDRTAGYVEEASVTGIDRPVRRETLRLAVSLRESASTSSPVVEALSAGQVVDVLGGFGDYEWLRSPSGRVGWRAVR